MSDQAANASPESSSLGDNPASTSVAGPQTTPPAVSRVWIAKPSLFKKLLPTLVVGGIIGAFVGFFVATRVATAPVFVGFAIGFTLVLAMALNRKFGQRRLEAKVRRLASEPRFRDPASLIRAVSELATWFPNRGPITAVPNVLIEQGQVGETYQVWWKNEPQPVRPLMHRFEPRLLDEADAAFDELSTAVENEELPTDADAAEAPRQRNGALDLRWLKRNIKLKGGWIVVACFSFALLVQGVLSIRQGRPTRDFWLWLGAVCIMFLVPGRSGIFKSSQWLLVPGGLIHRQARWRDSRATLHLFDRRRSVMCLYPVRKRIWLFTVADADVSETTWMTDKELNLLLRAWLSPLEPPSVERMSDWV